MISTLVKTGAFALFMFLVVSLVVSPPAGYGVDGRTVVLVVLVFAFLGAILLHEAADK